ncbi:hypothetical protein Tco_0631251 [Tanacetum coccineum]
MCHQGNTKGESTDERWFKFCACECVLHSRVKKKFDIFEHSGSRGLYREVTKWKSKGDKGFFDSFVRNYDGNCVYSLDGWAESGEASVGIQEKESLAQVWRKRLGHISEADLHELERREVLGIKGLGERDSKTFDSCKNSATEGLAERLNQTLLNKVRSPSAALEKKKPMDLWNGYLRKGRKTKPKRQNRTRNGKAWKRHSQVQAQDGFKEAQLLSMAGIRALKSLTEETQERRAEDLALSINRRLCEPNLIQRISLTGFPAQSVGSSNTDVLDSPCLLVLITGTSQSRQHGKSESDSYYLSD